MTNETLVLWFDDPLSTDRVAMVLTYNEHEMKVASTEQVLAGQAVDQGLPHSVKYQTLSSIEGESYLMIVYTREEL